MRNKAQHSARRKLQSQPYSQQAILENESLIANKADVLVRRVCKAAKDSTTGKVADVYSFCGLFSLEVILKCAFNRDYGESPDGSSSVMLRAMDKSALLLPIDATLPFLKKFNLGRHVPGLIGDVFREFELWVSMTTELLRDLQQQEKALDKTHRFMATPLLINKDDFLGRLLNETEMVEEAMGIAFAGSGTTSTTLIYLIYSLSRAPGIQMRLRTELQAAGESLNDVKDLPFLNAVIRETMRLYPTIISTLPRMLDVPIDVGGVVLPIGTEAGMQNYIHHRDPSVFPQPDEFVPDRWLQESKDMNTALTPFSVGPRNCIGQNLARAELYLATSKIFRSLKLTLHSDMAASDMEMEDRFNIAPKGRKLVVDVEVLK
jgi:cytochrome P450